jgi:ATP-dependent DNA helicase 2 subunit 2
MSQAKKRSNTSAVPPKVKGKRNREVIKPYSGLDVDALLSGARREKISKDNAISEFKQMVHEPDIPTVRDAAKQMGEITREVIKEYRLGALNYERAIENMKVMRYEMIECEEPDAYNKFIRSLKKDLLNGSLGGDARDLWFKIKSTKLGLIDSEDAQSSEVSVTEAAEFFSSIGMDMPTRSK